MPLLSLTSYAFMHGVLAFQCLLVAIKAYQMIWMKCAFCSGRVRRESTINEFTKEAAYDGAEVGWKYADVKHTASKHGEHENYRVVNNKDDRE